MALEVLVIGLLLITAAGVFHGTLGFGFPMLSTPVLAVAYDLKTAIILTMVPSFIVILISLYKSRISFEGISKHSILIATLSIGSIIGAWLVTWVNPEILKLFLATSIALYIFSGLTEKQLGHISKTGFIFPVLMGSFGGLLGGATNAVAPIVMIYLLEKSKSTSETIATLNLCFFISKVAQSAVLAIHTNSQEIPVSELFYISIFACCGLLLGFKVQKLIDYVFYKKVVKIILLAFMMMLTYSALMGLVVL